MKGQGRRRVRKCSGAGQRRSQHQHQHQSQHSSSGPQPTRGVEGLHGGDGLGAAGRDGARKQGDPVGGCDSWALLHAAHARHCRGTAGADEEQDGSVVAPRKAPLAHCPSAASSIPLPDTHAARRPHPRRPAAPELASRWRPRRPRACRTGRATAPWSRPRRGLPGCGACGGWRRGDGEAGRQARCTRQIELRMG